MDMEAVHQKAREAMMKHKGDMRRAADSLYQTLIGSSATAKRIVLGWAAYQLVRKASFYAPPTTPEKSKALSKARAAGRAAQAADTAAKNRPKAAALLGLLGEKWITFEDGHKVLLGEATRPQVAVAARESWRNAESNRHFALLYDRIAGAMPDDKVRVREVMNHQDVAQMVKEIKQG